MQYRSRCNIFNSFGNTLLFMYIYNRRVVNISENIAFLFYKEIYTKYLILYYIIMLSVNFFCNISSYDILAHMTKNYIALIYYAKIVHLLCQFHAWKVGCSAVCQAMYSQSTCKAAHSIYESITVVYYSCHCFLILFFVVN